MAKGKKTIIKEIKRISDDVVSVNGAEYIIIEDEKDIETAITMKITSHGNRILRFEDTKKMATIDRKRDINIVKYTILDKHRASRFRKSLERTILTQEDKKAIIANANSHIKAREIVDSYKKKDGVNYDKQSGFTTFYISEEQE
ncbi:hypothetical protein OAR97_00540 [Arcobacteraceae bacterium]|nr:hypothetical protein [Arcobacteraceae bacterium]